MSSAIQKEKIEPSLEQKGTLVTHTHTHTQTHTHTLAYKKSTGIIRERRCGPLTLREMLTWSV
jgi:hypothetical protein